MAVISRHTVPLFPNPHYVEAVHALGAEPARQRRGLEDGVIKPPGAVIGGGLWYQRRFHMSWRPPGKIFSILRVQSCIGYRLVLVIDRLHPNQGLHTEISESSTRV